MRLSCLQENLSRGLSVVGRAVATRTTLPITQNVLMSTDQSRLKLVATNLEIAITTWLGAQVEEEGSITVPARLLTEFVSSLPQERIDISSTPQGLGLALQCARFEANINGTDAADFPPIPTVESGAIGKVDTQQLRDAITHVAFAAATEDSRPVLTGVKVEISGASSRSPPPTGSGYRCTEAHSSSRCRRRQLHHSREGASRGQPPAGISGRDRRIHGHAVQEPGAVPPRKRRGSVPAHPGSVPQLLPAHPTVV